MAIASSGGRPPAVTLMIGARAVPLISTLTVVDCTLVLARKSSRGSIASRLSSVTTPRLKVRRRPSRSNSPRRMVRPPATAGAAGDPLTWRSPPISASSPRPRTNTARGAWILRASRIGVAVGGGGWRGRAAGGAVGVGRAGPPGLFISRTSSVGYDADCWPPIEISARSMVIGPEMSMPVSVEPDTLRLVDTAATRSGRLTSRALRLVTEMSGITPCWASRRMVPASDRVPLRPVWKVRRWICTVSPCNASRPSPPLSRIPDSGKASAPLAKSTVPLPLIFDPDRSTVRFGRSVPVTLRRSLPISGENGATSSAPVIVAEPDGAPAPRGRAALPLIVRFVAPPALRRASTLAWLPDIVPEPWIDNGGTSAASGRRRRKPVTP